MKSHHTIKIEFTIPTAKIVAVAVGVLLGVLLVVLLAALYAFGVELLTPVAGLPLVVGAAQASAVPDATSTPWTPPAYVPGEHPAKMAFDTIPFPVQVALNDMVDRVLIEKWSAAA